MFFIRQLLLRNNACSALLKALCYKIMAITSFTFNGNKKPALSYLSTVDCNCSNLFIIIFSITMIYAVNTRWSWPGLSVP